LAKQFIKRLPELTWLRLLSIDELGPERGLLLTQEGDIPVVLRAVGSSWRLREDQGDEQLSLTAAALASQCDIRHQNTIKRQELDRRHGELEPAE